MKKAYQLITVLIQVSLLISVSGVCAQNNLFEVPSNDTLEKGGYFFQQQALVTEDEINLGTTITWGLGHDLEIGLNLQQVKLNTRESPVFGFNDEDPVENPLLLINARKSIIRNEWYSLALGTRTGLLTAGRQQSMGLATFWYLNSRFDLPGEDNKFVFGPYYSNNNYSGYGNNLGVMAGVQYAIWKDKCSVQADFFSGNNLLSVINAGLVFKISSHWQLGAAAQVPVPGSDNPPGILFQVSRQ